MRRGVVGGRQVVSNVAMHTNISINIYMHMHALHVIAPKHCHIVAMGMPLLQLPNSLSLQVLSIKHWRQSNFAETPSQKERPLNKWKLQ